MDRANSGNPRDAGGSGPPTGAIFSALMKLRKPTFASSTATRVLRNSSPTRAPLVAAAAAARSEPLRLRRTADSGGASVDVPPSPAGAEVLVPPAPDPLPAAPHDDKSALSAEKTSSSLGGIRRLGAASSAGVSGQPIATHSTFDAHDLPILPTALIRPDVAFHHVLPRTFVTDYFQGLLDKHFAATHVAVASHETHGRGTPRGELDEVADDMLLSLRELKARGLFRPSVFLRNERFQAMKEALPCDLARNPCAWPDWREAWEGVVSDFTKVAVNVRGLRSTSLRRYLAVGRASVVDLVTGVLVHEWASCDAARMFLDIGQRLWSSLFEFRIDGVSCPVSAGFNVQGDYVTVTLLPPVQCDVAPFKVASLGDVWSASFPALADPLQIAIRRLCHALGTDEPPPLHYGADARYYVIQQGAIAAAVQRVGAALFAFPLRAAGSPMSPPVLHRARRHFMRGLQLRSKSVSTSPEVPFDRQAYASRLIDAYQRGKPAMEAARAALVESSLAFSILLDTHDENWTMIEDPYLESGLPTTPPNDPPSYLRTRLLRRVALDLLVGMVRRQAPSGAADGDEVAEVVEATSPGGEDAEDGAPPFATLTVDFIVRRRIIPTACHHHGVNLCFLYELAETLSTLPLPPPFAAAASMVVELRRLFIEACTVEMASRTVKSLARLDMKYGAGAAFTVMEPERRVMVPNRIAELLVDGDCFFWDRIFTPHLRWKFHTPESFAVPRGSIPMSLLLREMVMALGLEFEDTGHRFSHFCACASIAAAVFRPSALGQLAYEKRWAEIELEVPRMWVQLSKMPAGHPLKHSMMLRAATDTILTRASDLCGIAIGSIDQEVAHHHEGTVPHCEMMAMQVELELFASKSDRSAAAAVVTQLLRIAPCTGDGDPNAQIVGAKLLALGMHTKDLQLTSTACQVMHRAAHALAPLFSTTMNVAMNVSTGLMKHETSAAAVAVYFDVAMSHATLLRSLRSPTGSERAADRVLALPMLIAATATLVDASAPTAAVLGEAAVGALAFVAKVRSLVVEAAGPTSVAAAMVTYHLAAVALRCAVNPPDAPSGSPPLPAALVAAEWVGRLVACVRQTASRHQAALARGARMLRVLRKVASVLLAANSITVSAGVALNDHCAAMDRSMTKKSIEDRAQTAASRTSGGSSTAASPEPPAAVVPPPPPTASVPMPEAPPPARRVAVSVPSEPAAKASSALKPASAGPFKFTAALDIASL